MQPLALDLDDFSDSPHAEELRRAPRLGFAPALERAYLASHLARMRFRVRLWAALTFALTVAFGIGQVFDDDGISVVVLLQAGVTVPLALGLAALAWSGYYERFYYPFARVAAPLIHVLAAVFGAEAIARGAAEELAIVVLAMLAAFFFVGLLFRAAALTAIAMLVAFVLAALYQGMPHELLVRCAGLLAAAGFLGMVVAKDTEQSARRRFLEAALVVELLERDSLTGLKNRRAFEERLPVIWQQALREQRTLAFLFIDVDYFKSYNDRYGHQAGDATLRAVAAVVRGLARRPLDIAARFGGEEFAVVMYDTDRAHATEAAHALQRSVEALAIEHRGSHCAPHVTVSVGVAVVEPVARRSPHGALQLADQALYRAKSAGRNACVIEAAEEYERLRTGAYLKMTGS